MPDQTTEPETTTPVVDTPAPRPPARRRPPRSTSTTPAPSDDGHKAPVSADTYARAKAYIDQGMTTKLAFERVASDTGKSPGTIQTAYYRYARSLPDGGGVAQRPRSKTPSKTPRTPRTPRKPVEATNFAVLGRELHRAIDNLVSYATKLEATNRELQADADRWNDIRKMVAK